MEPQRGEARGTSMRDGSYYESIRKKVHLNKSSVLIALIIKYKKQNSKRTVDRLNNSYLLESF